MNFGEFDQILRSLSLVSRVRFWRKVDGRSQIAFSIIRTFEGWVLIDSTALVNFRFTWFMETQDQRMIELKYSDNKNCQGHFIGALVIKDIEEVDFV